MILKIDNSKKIAVVKDEFNNLFPYLKLEFFRHKHGVHKANPKTDMLNPELSLKAIRKRVNEGEILINENMTVANLESLFQEIFGISAQVFRKSGKSWLETSVTDDWTLKRQNDEGMELSSFAK
jgi:hypothetical protein